MPKAQRKSAKRPTKKADAKERVTERPAEPAVRPRGLWSGTLSFGLVTIPVEIYAAAHSERRSLRMLAPDGTPLARRYFSESDERLEREDLVRGYPLPEDGFVTVEEDELQELLPEQSRDINLSRFVPRGSVPPLYFERPYVLAPGDGSHSAYRLLAATMEHLQKVGIASFVMRGRQYVVAIEARDGLLWAETLRFQDELRPAESTGFVPPRAVESALVDRMRKAIHDFPVHALRPEDLRDRYFERLEAKVAEKRAQHEGVVEPKQAAAEVESGAEIIDLMAVLRESLSRQQAHRGEAKPGLKKTRQEPTGKRARKRATR